MDGEALCGTAPDLRPKQPANVECLKTIVAGAIRSKSMPPFPLSQADTKAVYAYFVKIARDGYEHGKRQPSGCRRRKPSDFLCHFFNTFQDERVGDQLVL